MHPNFTSNYSYTQLLISIEEILQIYRHSLLMTQLSNPVRSVIFDVDGLLLDTEPVYTRVTQEIVARFGKTFDWSVKAYMIGRAEEDSARFLVETLNLPITPEEYLAERNAMMPEGFAQCDAKAGAEALVRHLYQHNVPIAVATSSSREMFLIKITRHKDWFDLFPVIVTGDDPDIQRAKPAPDIFLTAASKLGADPHSTLVFEDAPSGLAAGIAADMRVVAVPDPNMDRTKYEGAAEILDSLESFEFKKYGLPEPRR